MLGHACAVLTGGYAGQSQQNNDRSLSDSGFLSCLLNFPLHYLFSHLFLLLLLFLFVSLRQGFSVALSGLLQRCTHLC